MIEIQKVQIPALPTVKPRRLYFYLPRSYKSGAARYPVLYMFDGHNVFYDSHATYGKSWGMKEYLEKTKTELILVAVECNPEGERRMNEYAPWDYRCPGLGEMEGLGKATMDWFTTVLKPQIDANYRTLPDRAHTMIAGSSMGGLMAIYALLEYNSVFSRAAALSPCFWVNPARLRDCIRTATIRTKTRIYMDMGGGETEGSTKPITAMFETAKRLSARGIEVAARVAPDALHSEAYWEKRIPVFIDYLLEPAPVDDSDHNTESVQ